MICGQISECGQHPSLSGACPILAGAPGEGVSHYVVSCGGGANGTCPFFLIPTPDSRDCDDPKCKPLRTSSHLHTSKTRACVLTSSGRAGRDVMARLRLARILPICTNGAVSNSSRP